MPPGDRCPAGGRPEIAGWVLGALEPDEAILVGEHLLGCAACRQAAAELDPVGRLLARATPPEPPEPPAALRARTLAAVERAAGQPGRPRRDGR